MKKLLAIAVIATGLTTLTACNTIEGAGKDVEASGEVIQDTAKDVKDEITE